MYAWRKMTAEQRQEVLSNRKRNGLPWHSLPHRDSDRTDAYLFTASCYEHALVIGQTIERLAEFEVQLLGTARALCREVVAWVVLPNHYHFLARADRARPVLSALGQMHGRLSFMWNGQDNCRGRQIWCGAAETSMKSERHFWATINYIHHNPVKHGYVDKSAEWPFSSYPLFLEKYGIERMKQVWEDFPIGEYGRNWDD